MHPFKLGDQVRDRVTGFTGTVTARAEYLYEQDAFLVENVVEPGRSAKAVWTPAARLVPLDQPDALQAERQRLLLSE